MTAQQTLGSGRRALGGRAVVVAGLALTGFSMRTAVTSVGAVLDEIEHGLHASGTVAGLITTLPVICFAVLGAATTRIAAHVGAHRLLAISHTLTVAGLAARPWPDASAAFVVLSILALTGAAVSNILMPGLVKDHFPDRVAPMTALYTTALAVGTTAGAGLTVPLGDAAGGWRAGLAWWALPAALAVFPWLTTVRADRANRAVPAGAAAPHRPITAMLRSRTAWAVMAFFATQSIQAYIAFGWFSRFLIAHGIARATAGAMVAVLSALGIPVSLLAPRLVPRHPRGLVVVLCAFSLVAYVGLAVAPTGGAWVWMVLAGIGSGVFPVSLTLIGLRSRTALTAASLSAFAQGLGYVVAGLGPLLFGALYGATGSWALPLTVLFVALALNLLTAWPATAPRHVDDELRGVT